MDALLTLILAGFENLTFFRLFLLAFFLLLVAIVFNADKLAVLLKTLFHLKK